MSLAAPSFPPPNRDEIDYPSSDGQPMGETGIHVVAILTLFEVLLDHLSTSDFIAADMFWYWQQGHSESRVAPDVMVVKGGGRAHRRSFFTWRKNGAVPAVVFEMASLSTWREDLSEKLRLYERLGVREYFLFDPEGEYLRPPLMGFRLVEGRYVILERDDEDRLRSEELGYGLKAEDTLLRLFDGTTGAPILTRYERVEQSQRLAEQERRLAEQERQNAEQERRLAEQERQNAEQERRLAEQAQRHAEQAQRHAEQAQRHAEQERQRADALASEVERLKTLLERTRGSDPATAE